MIIPKTLAHHHQNSPLQLIAETTPSFDNSCQHPTIHICKVGKYLDQRLWRMSRIPLVC